MNKNTFTLEALAFYWMVLGGLILLFIVFKIIPQIKFVLSEYLAKRGYELSPWGFETWFGLFGLVFVALWIGLGLWIIYNFW